MSLIKLLLLNIITVTLCSAVELSYESNRIIGWPSDDNNNEVKIIFTFSSDVSIEDFKENYLSTFQLGKNGRDIKNLFIGPWQIDKVSKSDSRSILLKNNLSSDYAYVNNFIWCLNDKRIKNKSIYFGIQFR